MFARQIPSLLSVPLSQSLKNNVITKAVNAHSNIVLIKSTMMEYAFL